MIKLAYEALMRAVIRFFDNRFVDDDTEVEYLQALNFRLLDSVLQMVSPSVAEVEETPVEDMKAIGKPIETSVQRRRRLEQESLAEWNRLVQEAKNRQDAGTSQSIEELEKDLGVSN